MHAILDPLERHWRNLAARVPTPPQSIGETQFFAWDEDPTGEGTVVCVGSNYGQYPTVSHIPTKPCLGLPGWMNNYKHAAGQVGGAWMSDWKSHHWLVGTTTPPLKPRYFIMTNLVPWITFRPWTLLSQTDTVGLVNLARSSFPTYLDDLAAALPDAFAVGHGIDEKTLPYLPNAIYRWKNWMLYANLSFPKTPSAWSAADERFKF